MVFATDYYPFGMAMPERSFDSPKYSYGFNGKEKDESGEWGDLTHYDYGFRIYNPGIGRFLSTDPLASSYPWYTPYQFAGNKPIKFIDLDGLEEAVYENYYGRSGVLTKWTDELWTYSVAINSSRTVHYLSEDGKPFEEFDSREGATGQFFGKNPMYMFTGDFPFDPTTSIDKDRLWMFTAYAKGLEDVKDYLPASAAANVASKVASKIPTFAKRLGGTVATVKSEIKAMSDLERAVDDFAIQLKKLGKKPSTAVGAKLPNGATRLDVSGPIQGNISPALKKAADGIGGIGTKRAGNVVGCCSEFRAANDLLLKNPQYKIPDLKFSPSIRPRTGQIVKPCSNCKSILPQLNK